MIEEYKMGICSQHTFNLSLTIYYCGSKVCREETWIPQYTDNYTLFYIYSGEGYVKIENKEFYIQGGQGFVVPPKKKVTYHSIKRSCEIAWVGFYGFLTTNYLERAGITLETPIFQDPQQAVGKIFQDILEDSKRDNNRYCRITAALYMIFSELLDIHDSHTLNLNPNNLMENYLKKALQYIDMNYAEKMTVDAIARYVGIDRKYLHFIFKKKLDIGPQQYLITYRMFKACTFLEDKDLSIADIGKIVGYENSLNFSKMFKKIIGVSPSEYKKNPIFIEYKVVNWSNKI